MPLTRIDLSGYGASTFSNWLNPARRLRGDQPGKFDVFVGRCAHEIIQVKSIIYPWGIKVVRTITLFRANSALLLSLRLAAGARRAMAASTSAYWVYEASRRVSSMPKSCRNAEIPIHPGICRRPVQRQNILETDEILPFHGQMVVRDGREIVDDDGLYIPNRRDDSLEFDLQPVFFDADVEIENAVSGFITKKPARATSGSWSPRKRSSVSCSSRRAVFRIDSGKFKDLIVRQGGTIGGPIDCVIDIGGSGQQMRLNRFDVNNSFAADG